MYADVYKLIGMLAHEEAYAEVDTSIRWPGHDSFPVAGSLTTDGAVAVLGKKFESFDKLGVTYDVLARSFGCCVALAAAERYQPRCLGRVILWGASPHWKLWQLFVGELPRQRLIAREKGVTIDERLYSSSIPIELLLGRCVYPVRFAFGEKDRFTSEGFVAYLKHDVCATNTRVSFAPPVSTASHEITSDCSPEMREAYRVALFKK